MAGLAAVRPEATVALLGHSYGSTVIGAAAPRLPPQVTDIAVFGSPGMGVSDVTRLGTSARVWAGQSARDWIRWVPGVRLFGLGHGTKPADPAFGARVFATADVAGHDHYLSPGPTRWPPWPASPRTGAGRDRGGSEGPAGWAARIDAVTPRTGTVRWTRCGPWRSSGWWSGTGWCGPGERPVPAGGAARREPAGVRAGSRAGDVALPDAEPVLLRRRVRGGAQHQGPRPAVLAGFTGRAGGRRCWYSSRSGCRPCGCCPWPARPAAPGTRSGRWSRIRCGFCWCT